ncbi:hypothetical protein PBY51_021298 [Eleginops maclovinus]|nr:hypothetical protein PBY51_021298 [Eleginops maclovinus]
MSTNATGIPPDQSSASTNAGLAVGLTLFFLLVVIVAGVIVYKRNKVRDILQLVRNRRQKKEEFANTAQDDPDHYTSMIKQSTEQTSSIYENLTTQATRDNMPAAKQSKFPSEPEEDVYLRCDSPDDAIYSNDPTCNLAILPDCQDEDVYIMPDSL